jgi:hydroxyacid-oxoacid transhydrogenase
VTVEPTDASFEEAARFAADGDFTAYISVGGGSVIDTCKVANLLATHPAPLMDYVNAPLGRALAIPSPLRPHIACPTTTGTGTECTGYAICDMSEFGVKSALAHKYLRPTMALVDPLATRSLPRSVLAASGFDVLCHAAESFTARPYTSRPRTAPGTDRPLAQGANPWSDIGCREVQ